MNENERNITRLSSPQTKAIISLLECNTVEAAAKKAKIGKVTLYKWLKDPDFMAALNEGRETLFNEALEALKAAAKKATERLIEIIDSEDEGQARLAAVAIIKYSLKGSEFKDLESRIEAIEKILEERMPYVS